MISNYEIKNFKSIKHLTMDCKKINIFIGKPNTGKSNILESLGIFSFPYGIEDHGLRSFVRFSDMTNLFYDNDISEKVEISADDVRFELIFEDNDFKGFGGDKEKKVFHFNFSYNYNGKGSSGISKRFSPFKLYKFTIVQTFAQREPGYLLPPHGHNLMQILLTNKAVKKLVADLLGEYDLRVVLKPQEWKIEVQKQVDEIIISYPYSLLSDTLQRLIFHLAAIETNKDSIIIFEEPEAHAFPYHTKFLAERIAVDKNNQYFISTHNPYFLLPILEKTPKDKVAVFITYLKDYQTRVRPIKENEISEIIDLNSSVFFNLDNYIEGN